MKGRDRISAFISIFAMLIAVVATSASVPQDNSFTITAVGANVAGQYNTTSPQTISPYLDDGDFRFRRIENGVGVYKYIGEGGEVVIPQTVDGIPVVKLYPESFFNNLKIKSVIIPEGVTCIGDSAFHGCERLESVKLPESLIDIERSSFYGCNSLSRIVIPKNVDTIERGCFASRTTPIEIVFENQDTFISDYAFDKSKTSIFGYTGSVVHQFAERNKIQFYDIKTYYYDVIAGSTAITTFTTVMSQISTTTMQRSTESTTITTTMLAETAVASSSVDQFEKRYDTTGDSRTTIADAVVLTRYITEDSTLDPVFSTVILFNSDFIDINKDGELTILDVISMLSYLLTK